MSIQQTEPSNIDGTQPQRPIKLKDGPSKLSKEQKKAKKTLMVFVAGALVIGFISGVLLMRQRHNDFDSIAAVNGQVITKDQLFSAMQLVAGQQTMHKLVQDEIQLQFAKKLGLVPSNEQINAEYNFLSNQPNYDLILRNAQLPDEAFHENLKLQMAQEAVFTQGVTVSDAEVQKYYAEQINPTNPKSLFYRPPVTTVQAIAVSDRASAEAAITQISNGIPFEIVAEKVSLDASRANGGRLNPLMYGESALTRFPQIEQQVFQLHVGQLSDPINFGNVWWVFKCDERTPALTIPFNQVAAQAHQEALVQKGLIVNSSTLKQEFADFRKSSQIQSFWPQYARAIGAQQ